MHSLGKGYLEQIHFESPLKCCSRCHHRLENLWKCTSECLVEQGFVSTLVNRDPDCRNINSTGYLFSVPWIFLPSSPFLSMPQQWQFIHITSMWICSIQLLFLPWVMVRVTRQVIQGMFCFCDKHSLPWYGIFNYLNKKSLCSTFQQQISPFFETHQ